MDRPPPTSRSSTLRTIAFAWLGLLAGFAIGVEWIRSRPSTPAPSGGIDLVGAGATLPYPLYRRWFAEYRDASGVRINYFSLGSAAGIRLLLADSIDFGASDRPLTAAERAQARCGAFELPTVAGAVTVAYNLPGFTTPLHLDAEVLADIFLGRVTQWNAAPIRALNPGLELPALRIQPIQRARVTGTSAVFSRYLETSARWRSALTRGQPLTSASAQVEGNEGVTASIAATPGAVGVVEFTYAQQARLAVAALKNPSGAYVEPNPASIAAAADELLSPAAADTMLGAINASSEAAYPAVALTRIIADGALADSVRGAHFVAFARWTLREGARIASEVGYAPLPDVVALRQTRRLDALTIGQCPAVPATP